jgi:penicillin-binding protein 1A
VGFDDTTPLGALETGARAASPIWVSFMKNVATGSPEEFPVPEGIVAHAIDPATGLLTKDESMGIREYFREGTEPKQYTASPSIKKIREQDTNLNFD